MKTCSKCAAEKPLTEFYVHRRDKYQAHCKACNSARVNARRATHKATTDALKDVPCKDCGGRFPSECMDFDHVSDNKSFDVSTGSYRSLDVLLQEAAKCEIVCANCHRIRTKRRLAKPCL